MSWTNRQFDKILENTVKHPRSRAQLSEPQKKQEKPIMYE